MAEESMAEFMERLGGREDLAKKTAQCDEVERRLKAVIGFALKSGQADTSAVMVALVSCLAETIVNKARKEPPAVAAPLLSLMHVSAGLQLVEAALTDFVAEEISKAEADGAMLVVRPRQPRTSEKTQASGKEA